MLISDKLKPYIPDYHSFKQIDEFAMWKEWQKFVNDFMSKKDSIPNNKMMNLIQKTQDELKLLFKRTIVEALAEILILELDVDVIEIYSSQNHRFLQYIFFIKNFISTYK